jgi:hypothetical protein
MKNGDLPPRRCESMPILIPMQTPPAHIVSGALRTPPVVIVAMLPAANAAVRPRPAPPVAKKVAKNIVRSLLGTFGVTRSAPSRPRAIKQQTRKTVTEPFTMKTAARPRPESPVAKKIVRSLLGTFGVKPGPAVRARSTFNPSVKQKLNRMQTAFGRVLGANRKAPPVSRSSATSSGPAGARVFNAVASGARNSGRNLGNLDNSARNQLTSRARRAYGQAMNPLGTIGHSVTTVGRGAWHLGGKAVGGFNRAVRPLENGVSRVRSTIIHHL